MAHKAEKPNSGVFMGYNVEDIDAGEQTNTNSQIGIIKGISQSVTLEEMNGFNVHFSDG